MRFKSLVVGGVLAASLCLQASGQSQAPIDERAVLTVLNARWLGAYKTRDVQALNEILSERFVGVYSGGPLTKAELIARAADPNRVVSRVDFEDLQIHFKDDVAVVSATSVLEATQNQQAQTTTSRYVDVYVKEDGVWRAIAADVVRKD